MEYNIKELLPLVTKLTNKYTSMESSSVTYETAQMLMESVLYSINECFVSDQDLPNTSIENISYEELYQRGYALVIEKIGHSKEIYHRILQDFEDYGCEHYQETIVMGMPQFFLRYDPKFKPMDHLLTLDYPSLYMKYNKNGVDMILSYLLDIEIEMQFLSLFPKKSISNLLQRIRPDYKRFYFDNIAYPVLLNALGCIIAKSPIASLSLTSYDCEKIKDYFKDDSKDQITEKIRSLIHFLCKHTTDESMAIYFEKSSSDYGVRIWESLRNDSLEHLFAI